MHDLIRALAHPRELRRRRAARRFYSTFVRPGSLCFDVGAHLGDRTRVFRDLDASVIAIEPQPECVHRLEREFGRDSRVTVVPMGLAAAEGELELSVCDEAPTVSTMSERWRSEGRFAGQFHWTSTRRVAVTTLDHLIGRFGRPSFVKIDVEGFERSVIDGLSSPIEQLSFEFTREFIGEARACVQRLAGLGPISVNASIGESMSFLLPAWTRDEDLFARLEALDDPLLWGDIHVRSK